MPDIYSFIINRYLKVLTQSGEGVGQQFTERARTISSIQHFCVHGEGVRVTMKRW